MEELIKEFEIRGVVRGVEGKLDEYNVLEVKEICVRKEVCDFFYIF